MSENVLSPEKIEEWNKSLVALLKAKFPNADIYIDVMGVKGDYLRYKLKMDLKDGRKIDASIARKWPISLEKALQMLDAETDYLNEV